MKYELSHDVLALKAYERASADDKALRKVERLIKERYAFYRQRQALLSKDDLDYINPYLDHVTISEEEEAFIKKSDRVIKRRRRLLAGLVIAVFLVLSSLTVFALIQNQNAQREKDKAIQARNEANQSAMIAQQKEQEAQKEKENAIAARKEADENALIAQENEQEAEIQRDNALAARKEADENARIAREKEQEAQKEKDNAIAASKLAKENEERANNNKNRADSLRILSLAQSLMAIAAQIEDPTLKAKLANQAYDFHSQQNGDPYDPVIHDGLRTALLANNWKNTVQKHQSAITGLAFTPDGQHLFSTARDGKLIQWNWNNRLDSANVVTLNNPLITHGGLSVNKEWLAVSGDKTDTLQIFKLADFPKPWSEKSVVNQSINDLIFAPYNKHQLILATSKGPEYIDLQSTRTLSPPFIFPETFTQTIAIHPSGKWMAAINQDGEIEIGQVADEGSENALPTNQLTSINALAFSQDGKFFAAGDRNGKVWLCHLLDRELVISLSGHTARISQVGFYQKENHTFLVSTGYDGKAQLWYWNDWEKDRVKEELSIRLPIVLKAEGKWEFSLTFSPDGKHILMGNRSGMIQQWLTNLEDMVTLLRQMPLNLKLSEEERRQYLKGEEKN